jgi:hypothetical protein
MQQPRENFWDKDGHCTNGTRISITPASFHSKLLTQVTTQEQVLALYTQKFIL